MNKSNFRAAVFLTGLLVSSTGLSASETLTARAVIKANAQATVSVFLSARVRYMPVRAGQSFKRGDLLISFDCQRYKAELQAKKAAYSGKMLLAKNNKRLLRHQAIGASEVAISVAQMKEAEANVAVQRALVDQCEVRAPYGGKVVERLIKVFETPGASQPLMKIIDTSRYRVELIVPSRWLGWLKKGTEFEMEIDETGQRLRGRVSRLGAVVDAVSQTIKITGAFIDSKNSVLPGMSGTATFSYSGS